jgi:hypothetical protein
MMGDDLDLGSLLSAPKSGASWGNYDFDKPSLAVVAMGEIATVGIVLHTVGGHVKMEMEEGGIYVTEDLGIDPPEPGIWVWEGKGYWSPGNWEHPDEGEMELRGKFRQPTDEEWAAIRKGECPWNDDDWKEQDDFANHVTYALDTIKQSTSIVDDDGVLKVVVEKLQGALDDREHAHELVQQAIDAPNKTTVSGFQDLLGDWYDAVKAMMRAQRVLEKETGRG